MAGGRRIDDHKSWMGPAGKNMVMPEGAKTKAESSAEGVGGLSSYEDTTEMIRASQVKAANQVKKHPRQPLERN